ncbi:hypothetical protein ADIARSV_2826 [Arcticibacter svalbardensis MN12-7]|uniref:Uncharacterized protein n=1 Tax=Arcticibacter svalbardensis MN12-7 TaxID=1150600 RepID=R9GQ75_9SPHI|nr:hypothetical protein ADIARSV_2826 [Arcticibacter svalbardensis MN12-7]
MASGQGAEKVRRRWAEAAEKLRAKSGVARPDIASISS